MTPIHQLLLWAADLNTYSHSDRPQIIRLLLEHGANPNVRDNRRRTPLQLVSSSGLVLSLQLEIARSLLVHGADVDVEDGMGRTPLQVALTGSRQDEMVQLLSEYCSK
ncbi:ankyrin repeat protein [Lactarius pseudohatsudake]|nr:ankyrin repeat protein [Lactarius pseudohatsudake]